MQGEKLSHMCPQLPLLKKFGYNNWLFMQWKSYRLKKSCYLYHRTCLAHVRWINTLSPDHVYTRFAIFHWSPTTYIYVWGKRGIISVLVIFLMIFFLKMLYSSLRFISFWYRRPKLILRYYFYYHCKGVVFHEKCKL